MLKILNYIDGDLTEPASGAFLTNMNPAEGSAYSFLPDSDETDVHRAALAAEKAFRGWSAMTATARSAILIRIADAIDANLEKLARAESIDNGKPVGLARMMDIPRASANLRFYATASIHVSDDAHITGTEALNYTLHSPIGVAGCISPWNLPLYLFTWKIAPALAAGCTVVAKPSELTPMTAYLLSELCIEAGLPQGVLNIVHGLGSKAGQAIVDHPLIRAISFTGGTVTGRKIAQSAAPHFKKLSLELGGKNPNIIFADCDLDKAVETSVRSSFTNQGEICLCGSRIFIEESVFDQFLTKFVARTELLTIGDPLEDATDVGALVSKDHLEKVLSYIDLARQEGGTLVTGGTRVTVTGRCAEGFFIKPAVIIGLSQKCRTNQEEIFGPVVTIQPFKTEEEVIEWANATTYGLSATLWTENLTRAHKVSAALKSGIVWVNCWLFRDLRTPFGGMKNSGMGREGGWDGLRFFMDSKNVCVRL
jgi:aminomuconate-semialdehyde/2-hydroxymuconate-6-semialdehyde dehydrogenase